MLPLDCCKVSQKSSKHCVACMVSYQTGCVTLYGSGRRSHSVQGAIQIIRTHLYGEKLHSYVKTVILGGLQPLSSPFPLPMLYGNNIMVVYK